MNKFDYLIKKIEDGKFENTPFKHLHIKNFLIEDDFKQIINSEQINLNNCSDDNELISKLSKNKYEIIDFPGCVKDIDEYIEWHKTKEKTARIHSATSGFGLTYRLTEPKDEIISELHKFSQSEEFSDCLMKKFNINAENYRSDIGIQKFLDGYEISPHPDIRSKAITFMFNINPSNSSENNDHHTQLLEFKKEHKYLEELWSDTSKIERSWVPWNWCKVTKQLNDNNSIIIFAPNNNTLHAVKANYNHLDYQRTLLYGNIWLTPSSYQIMSWEHIEELNLLRKHNL